MNYLTSGPEDAETTLILAHGAGAPMDSEFMNVIAEGIAAAGIRVVRFEFPYMARRRTEGKKSPPNRQPILIETWQQAIKEHRGSNRLFIGGKSMGGRIASMIADEEQVDGLICLGYPFHPPGKPDKRRTDHLRDLETPTLILQGTRDPFGNENEVPGYDLSPAIRLHWLPDGDHSFKPRKKSGRTQDQNWKESVDKLVDAIC